MRSILRFLFGAFLVLSLPASAQDRLLTLLDNGPWKVAPQGDVKEAGEQLSVPGYADDKWLTAHVPGTAFADYVSAGKEPDPNFGDNASKVNRKKYDQNYWYRTEFTVPADYFQLQDTNSLKADVRCGEIAINNTILNTSEY